MQPSNPQTENQAYEVPGRQLGWRVSQLQQQGLLYDVQPMAGGIYIVIVQQPSGAHPFAYQPPHASTHPRRWPHIDPMQAAQWLALAAFAAGLIWFAWSLFAGGATEPPAAADTANAWDWLDNLRLPWEPEPLPDGEPVVLPVDDAGFRWPWDAAADAAADTASAAESVQGSITAVAGAVVAVLGMLIILSIARRKP